MRLAAPKVLIADDSPLVLRMLEKMLLGGGYDVLTAKDGLEAIEKAVAEEVQLVILDHRHAPELVKQELERAGRNRVV